MMETNRRSTLKTGNLIFIPALITLTITLLRLVGELRHWPKPWFDPNSALIGVTWLAPVFGVYFAIKLTRAGEWPRPVWRSVGFAILGVAIVVGGAYLGGPLNVNRSFYMRLLYIWFAFAFAALVTWAGWPALFKTLVAYAYAARIPVVIIMFFAFKGNWGTHYDGVPPDVPNLSLVPKWLWLGFFPQLVFWVGFTIVTGMLFGSLAAGLMRLVRRPAEVPS